MDENGIKQRMEQAVEAVRRDSAGIRTGRAAPSLVEGIIVDAYGGASRLRVMELASVTVPDAQTLLIAPWDKSVIGEIKKAIDQANIGLNPVTNSDVIRITLPPLTGEDREKYIKLLHQKLENGRIMIRQIRQDGMRDIKKGFEDKTVTEDQRVVQEKKLQELTDRFVGKIEEVGRAKEEELRSM